MNEEKMKILKMLEDGKISAQEAVRLLEFLGESGEPHSEEKATRSEAHSWVDDIRDAAMEVGRTVRDAIDDEGGVFNFEWDWFTSTEKMQEHLVERLGDKGIHTLVIEGFNSAITFSTHDETGYDSSNAEFEINAGARTTGKNRHRDRKFGLAVQGGIMRLEYDEKAFKYVGIKVSVPKTSKLSAVILKTRNGAITVSDLAADSVETITKNGAIKIINCMGQRLTCETKNGGITLRDIEMADIGAITKNAKIVLDDISGRECECFISAETKNASIKTKLLNEGRALKISAATTNSSISADIKDLVYYTNEKTRIEALTAGYEQADYKMDLTLKSANGKIQVR